MDSLGVTNIEFHCGKVEDLLMAVLFRLDSKDVVAVVDPPRAGLRNTFSNILC